MSLSFAASPCISEPCKNGGGCSQGSTAKSFVCTCVDGFSDATCSTPRKSPLFSQTVSNAHGLCTLRDIGEAKCTSTMCLATVYLEAAFCISEFLTLAYCLKSSIRITSFLYILGFCLCLIYRQSTQSTVLRQLDANNLFDCSSESMHSKPLSKQRELQTRRDVARFRLHLCFWIRRSKVRRAE